MEPSKRFTARGANSVECATEKEVLATLCDGVRNRTTGATRMNAKSSRSHALFSIELELPSSECGAAPLTPRLHFVDLAGSERTKKAETSGLLQRQGIMINLSLSSLGHVIDALAKGQDHVPFRSSALTMLLQDSLGGNSQTLMVACVRCACRRYACV